MAQEGISFEVTGIAPALARLENLTGRKLASRTAASLSRSTRRVMVPIIAKSTGWKYGGHGGRYPTKGILGKRQSITVRRIRTRPGEMVALSVKPRGWAGTIEAWVVKGTKEHVIRARSAVGSSPSNLQLRSLNGNASGGGAMALVINGLFSEQVHHPGAKPTPYIATAARAGIAQLTSALADDLTKGI